MNVPRHPQTIFFDQTWLASIHSTFCFVRKLRCMCCISLRSGAVSRSCGGLVYPPDYMLNSLLLSDRLLVKDDLAHVVQECLGLFCAEIFFHFPHLPGEGC